MLFAGPAFGISECGCPEAVEGDRGFQRLGEWVQYCHAGFGYSWGREYFRGRATLVLLHEVGYETYQRILNEALVELRDEEFPELQKVHPDEPMAFATDCVIDTILLC